MIPDDEKIEFLKRMVEIYSPSGKENEVAEFLVNSFYRYDIDAYIDSVGNVVAEKKGKGPRILLAGHMDTVTGEIPVRIENDILWGRGSVDAKGPLSAFFFAFVESNANMIFAGLVDEERHSKGAKNLKIAKPDFIIIGEPSGVNGVTIGYKGSAVIEIEKVVKKFHGSLGQKGATEELIEVWYEISKDFGSGWDQPTGRIVECHTYERDFDFYGKISINIRFPPGYNVPSVGNVVDYVPPYMVSPRSRLVRAFVRAIRENKLKPVLKKKSGTADMNILAPKFGVDAVAYGPGDSSLDHTPNEHINISEYLESIHVLKSAISNLTIEKRTEIV